MQENAERYQRQMAESYVALGTLLIRPRGAPLTDHTVDRALRRIEEFAEATTHSFATLREELDEAKEEINRLKAAQDEQ